MKISLPRNLTHNAAVALVRAKLKKMKRVPDFRGVAYNPHTGIATLI